MKTGYGTAYMCQGLCEKKGAMNKLKPFIQDAWDEFDNKLHSILILGLSLNNVLRLLLCTLMKSH